MQKNQENASRYDDIIHLPHPVSKQHTQMSVYDRAAQFSPFAALSGYGDAIKETERFTGEKIELDEDARAILDEKLRAVLEQPRPRPEVTITYYQPDGKKAGGSYVTCTGRIKKTDPVQGLLVLEDGTKIPLADMSGIEDGIPE